MKILADNNYVEIEKIILSKKMPKFRAKQIYDAILQSKDAEDISNVPKSILTELLKEFIIKPVEIFEIFESKDGTKKYLIKLADGNFVESVFLFQNYGNTICLSTQVGCRMGCSFCASTVGGLIRNLSNGEMLSIIALLNADNGNSNQRNFTNIVLMGSGEPLDNYDNVIKFIKDINMPESFNISMRNISLSTCGLVDEIYKLAQLDLDITLCISLHASNNQLRKKIMPIAHKYNMDELLRSIKNYINITKRRVILEYCLIKNVNDREEHIDQLQKLFENMKVHFNVISVNPYDDRYKKPDTEFAERFVKKLENAGLSATLRTSKGADISGACGQLKNQKIK